MAGAAEQAVLVQMQKAQSEEMAELMAEAEAAAVPLAADKVQIRYVTVEPEEMVEFMAEAEAVEGLRINT